MYPRFTIQLLIADYTSQDTRNSKDAPQDNRKKKGARGITGSRLRLIGPKSPLMMLGKLNQSLDFANIVVLVEISIICQSLQICPSPKIHT